MVFGVVGETLEVVFVLSMVIGGLLLLIWIQRATSRHD